MKTESIRLNEELSPETKVYLIGKKLRESNRINDDLWYSILELKDRYYKTITAEAARLAVEEVNQIVSSGEIKYYES